MDHCCIGPARALLLLTVGLAACGGTAEAPPALTPADRARETVAGRLGIPVDDVSVISITARDFPDSSLDCPEPDMLYQQVITPGHQVIVEADGRRFDVRVAGASARICHRRKGGSHGGQRASPTTELADRARADLARRLQCAPEEIRVTGIRALGPDDALPGCTWDCRPDTGVCGYAISLLHGERRFEYFASQALVQPCPPLVSS